jgi:hypothetical protein
MQDYKLALLKYNSAVFVLGECTREAKLKLESSSIEEKGDGGVGAIQQQ